MTLSAGTSADAAPTIGARLDWDSILPGLQRDTVAWLETYWEQILIALLAGAAIYAALLFARHWAHRLCLKASGATTWYGIVGRAVAKTGQPFLILAAARVVVAYAIAPAWLTVTVSTLFTVVAVIQGAIWLREIVFGAIEHRMLDQRRPSRALASAMGIIRLLVTIGLFAIAAILILGNLGVNVNGLIAGLGVGGIAIGLAAQGIFADLFAALAIIFDRPFRVGDSISYDKGSGSGTVEAIGLKSTRIRGAAGEERILANKKLLEFEILNTTRRLHNRFKFEFFVGFATLPETVVAIPAMLKRAVEKEGFTLVHGGLVGFAENGLAYDVEFESVEADFPAGARDRVAAAILREFAAHDISFAYPTHVNLVAEKTKPTPPARPHVLSEKERASA